MSREITGRSRPGDLDDDSKKVEADKYLDRLFKYIPAEIVAAYVFTLGVMSRLQHPSALPAVQWIVFGIFCFLTWIYLRYVQKVRKPLQLLISVISYIIWVFSIGGPFTFFGWYDQAYGEILLPVFTLLAGVIEP